jgi:hypothetical protein
MIYNEELLNRLVDKLADSHHRIDTISNAIRVVEKTLQDNRFPFHFSVFMKDDMYLAWSEFGTTNNRVFRMVLEHRPNMTITAARPFIDAKVSEKLVYSAYLDTFLAEGMKLLNEFNEAIGIK